MVLGSNRGWAGPLSSCLLILVCVNYDLNGSLRINSRLHARLNNQISHPILLEIGHFYTFIIDHPCELHQIYCLRD